MAPNKKVKIKRVGVLSCGKIIGFLYVLLGLVVGGFMTLFSLLGSALSRGGGPGVFSILFGVGAIVVIPLIYGTMGFLGGIVIASFYNFTASKIGGLELETE